MGNTFKCPYEYDSKIVIDESSLKFRYLRMPYNCGSISGTFLTWDTTPLNIQKRMAYNTLMYITDKYTHDDLHHNSDTIKFNKLYFTARAGIPGKADLYISYKDAVLDTFKALEVKRKFVISSDGEGWVVNFVYDYETGLDESYKTVFDRSKDKKLKEKEEEKEDKTTEDRPSNTVIAS